MFVLECLPHLPLHCWNETILRSIGNVLRKYIDNVALKDQMFACAIICVEVDLEKVFPESILLTLEK
jgi:hypothetical protein